MKEKIVILGGGGHAKVIISILKKIDKYEIVGYTDFENKGKVLGIKYLGNDNILHELYKKKVKNAVIGLGQIKSTNHRRRLSQMVKEIGFDTPSIVSPDSIINEDVVIAEGTVVMDGAIVNSGSIIGKYSILNTRCSIDHDCKIGDFTHVAPGTTLSGEVTIGNNVLIGTGTNIIQQVSICDNTIISAGSTIFKNISKKGIYGGNPAKFIKEI
ncbi:MAG: acetyltransferase [Candidatus Helarchaeota archaeon]